MTDIIYTKFSPTSPQQSVVQRKPVPTRDATNETETESFISNPQQNSPNTISKWGVGWKTPSMMVVFYVIALLIAGAHLGLFLYLDNKPADGRERAAPQSYVSTASNILANVFSLSLKSSLAIAFTQYLWYTLRKSSLKVSTIESLFAVRSNPFLLLDPLIIARGPILVVIAIFIWGLQIAASFPPGALTIVSATRTSNQFMNIPTFNASFYGNGSGYDAERYSFDGFYNYVNNETINPNSNGTGILITPFVKNLATHTLINGMPSAMASPCGANCSFTLVLETPYLQCNATSWSNINFTGNLSNFDDPFNYPIFNATWDGDLFNITTYLQTHQSINADPVTQEVSWTVTTKANNTVCTPARTTYSLDILFENNIQNMSISTSVVTPLDIDSPAPPTASYVATHPTDPGAVVFPGFMYYTYYPAANASNRFYGSEALNWTTPFISWYRDLQLMALIDGMANSLSGTVSATISSGYSKPLLSNLALSSNGSVVTSTPFDNAYGIYTQPVPFTISNADSADASAVVIDAEAVSFSMTQDLLNQALLNVTLSTIPEFGWWSTNTQIKQWESINVYSFSRPLNLLVPYFLSLLLALPFLSFGAFALHKNGVSAVDGGFIQLITTSTGSATLDKVAAGGCLGGSEGTPKELLDLKIRFGELVGEGKEGEVRRAGFGTNEETGPLVKGGLYGG